jgi:hypothetical protein
MALIGETRLSEILANVILPWRQARAIPAWDGLRRAARAPNESPTRDRRSPAFWR